jgi:hypothetical protein
LNPFFVAILKVSFGICRAEPVLTTILIYFAQSLFWMRSVCQRLYVGAPVPLERSRRRHHYYNRHPPPRQALSEKFFLSHSGNNIFVGIIAGFQPVTKPL